MKIIFNNKVRKEKFNGLNFLKIIGVPEFTYRSGVYLVFFLTYHRIDIIEFAILIGLV